jgi:pyruvate,orthophosphate dikinase
MPVPHGFTISTDVCDAYYRNGKRHAAGIKEEVEAGIKKLEKAAGKKLGDPANPLLVSVRSGAAASMPGMMDTILNLGLNENVVGVMAVKSGNARWAYDCYRRFIQMYSEVYEKILDEIKHKKGAKLDTELSADDLKEIVKLFKDNYKKNQGKEFPQDPKEQLMGAIRAVFRSWNNHRAIVYRKMHDIPHDWGTAVNIQAMVFGNMGSRATWPTA